MKLLLDENLSRRLVSRLCESYPGTTHVEEIEFRGATDRSIWEHAKAHGFTIVTKDNDFRQLSVLLGAPPKVIWLSVGNAGTDEIVQQIDVEFDRIKQFLNDPETDLLIVVGRSRDNV